jgi:GNAT superfamily N-acetyltransferase
MAIALIPATPADRAFAERTYFQTQRWIIEELFGWRGDGIERAKFEQSYDEARAAIISVDGIEAGWMQVRRVPGVIELEGLYIVPAHQRAGTGTHVLKTLIEEADSRRCELKLSAARINPARRLYERLGFRVVREDDTKIHLMKPPAGAAD